MWRKEVEIKRGRKERRDTEGVEKVRDTGGGVLHCQNKESVYTNCLPHKTLERSKSFSNSGNFLRGLLWTLKIFSASVRYRVSLLQQQVSQTKFWTVRNLETTATLGQDARPPAAALPLSAERWTCSEILRNHGRTTNNTLRLFTRFCTKV